MTSTIRRSVLMSRDERNMALRACEEFAQELREVPTSPTLANRGNVAFASLVKVRLKAVEGAISALKCPVRK